ncbi:long-chain-fatty-acid--CoA ligase FadD13-like [Pecten maximus]|uniref:long-chain-fatty-acid--CoA ligase FadD13-like n=1 Tax=Pecten maximus TaxID=6579 RepID=UPI001457ED1A|nr:long-chain-fatty-acid--CoA ligase FadD13-like [Pecten maximus]
MTSHSRLSYSYTCPPKPFSYTTLPRVVAENAQSHPDQEIFILRRPDGSRTQLTNTELYNQGTQLARYIVSTGIQKGDRIALMGPNTLEMVVGHVGILSAGAVVLNINSEKTNASDVHDIFESADIKFVIVDSGEHDELLPATKALLQHSDILSDYSKEEGKIEVLFLRAVDLEGFHHTVTLKDIYAMNLNGIHLPNTFPEDSAVIFTTSGSTGKSKMVVHTHYSLACCPFSWIPDVDYESIDYNDRPFSWVGGTPVFHILMRRSRVFIDAFLTINGKNTDFLWRVIKEERCTDALLFPYVIRDLLDLPQRSTEDGYRLNHVVTGGQMIDSLCTKIMESFSRHLVVVYGCTELLGLNMYGPLVKGETLMPGEVGRPYPGVEVRIVDEEENPIGLDAIGKVQARGPCILKEYFGSKQLTANAFAPGSWFRTGDIGKISCNGSLVITGREKDVISRGGRKIYPVMLEDLIKQMSCIKYVCAVPVPDRRLIEEVCVCFVSSDRTELKEKDVKMFCEKTLFARSTLDGLGVLPAFYVKFEEFPSLSNGKPDKRAIRNEAIRRLHLSVE